ncbi:MAG: patatin-like phospholipase family protein [Alphaproteobacteria bacterium]
MSDEISKDSDVRALEKRAAKLLHDLDKDAQAAFLKEARELRDNERFREALAILDQLDQCLRDLLDGAEGDAAATLAAYRVLVDLERAQAVYQDPEIHPRRRYRMAWDILSKLRAPEGVLSAEAWRLAGAVAKRRWQQEGRPGDLDEAIVLYRSAYERDKHEDKGYGAVNAAYLLLVRARLEDKLARRTGTSRSKAEETRAEAAALYRSTVDILAPDSSVSDATDYWHLVTLAEALFGLGRFEEAAVHLAAAREAAKDEPRRIKTTFEQLVRLATLRGERPLLPGTAIGDWPEAWQALSHLLAESAGDRERRTRPVLNKLQGTVGLALSGGGFRAALYHLGVLARLAEMDVLRSVDVISTVSGGSVVGAHYYLELRKLLQETADADIERRHYICLVKRLIRTFLDAIQQNIRMQAFASLGANIKTTCREDYSRTHHLGELYEKLIYARVDDGHDAAQRRLMSDLKIRPQGDSAGKDFNPKKDNWRRGAKAPALLINTTSLNSGHNWRFTASWMGEPPGLSEGEIDQNSRYHWEYYDRLPKGVPKVTLGSAVAASSCVPGLFDPLPIADLYSDGRTVRLVDGGVHDNQGLAGLIDEGCNVILCSDASGQMKDSDLPRGDRFNVLTRSNSIMMRRMREAQYEDMRERADSGALSGFFFVHLKQGLERRQVYWRGAEKDDAPPGNGAVPAGVDPEVQRLLAEIRTDLDSFGDAEAYALMLVGYRSAQAQFQALQAVHLRDGNEGTSWCDVDIDAAEEPDWPFLDERLVSAVARADPSPGSPHAALVRQLEVAAKVPFKVFALVPKLRYAKWITLGLLALVTLVLVFVFRERELSVTLGGLFIAVGIAVMSLFWKAAEWLDPEKAMRRRGTRALIALALSLAAKMYLRFFEEPYKRHMSLDRLKRPSGRTSA